MTGRESLGFGFIGSSIYVFICGILMIFGKIRYEAYQNQCLIPPCGMSYWINIFHFRLPFVKGILILLGLLIISFFIGLIVKKIKK